VVRVRDDEPERPLISPPSRTTRPSAPTSASRRSITHARRSRHARSRGSCAMTPPARRTLAFMPRRVSRASGRVPSFARPAGQTRPEGRVMLSGASRAPAPRRPSGGSALLAALSRCRRTRSLRPAPRTCGSPSLSGKCLWRVPWFHENAILQVGGPDDDPADDGAGCAAGDMQVRRVGQRDTSSCQIGQRSGRVGRAGLSYPASGEITR